MTGTVNERFGLDAAGRCSRPFSRKACALLLVMIIATTVFAVRLVRGFLGEHQPAIAEAKETRTDTVAPPATAPPTGNRLVWGPPMTVVIRGEQWTVRTVMEQAR